MNERGISEQDAEWVLAHPTRQHPGNIAGRRVYEGYPLGQRVRVVIVEGTNPPLVVTITR